MRLWKKKETEAEPAPPPAREPGQFRERLVLQWQEGRAARRSSLPLDLSPATNFKVARVPYGVDLAAQWSWRIAIISIVVLSVLYLAKFFIVVTLPLVIALFATALMAPAVNWLETLGVPRKLGALIMVLSGLTLLASALGFVSAQVGSGFEDLSAQVVVALDQAREWLQNGPLGITDKQLDTAITDAQKAVAISSEDVIGWVTQIGAAVGSLLAGAVLVVFATFFFLADGAVIWSWIVRLVPRGGRRRVDTSGRLAWRSLLQFVRATMLVAAVDAIGIMIAAAVLGIPFIGAIGVLVFISAFVPIVGALLSGAIAVLLALVAKGPVVAALMLLGVLIVQQVETHLLQPFLMGRLVSVHPLAVIIVIAIGILVAGVAGALIAVPLAAAINVVILHLASYDPASELEYGPEPAPADEELASEEVMDSIEGSPGDGE